jgi:acyl-CoA reductase-like NAD-dependent aldehyde dehydrogenase
VGVVAAITPWNAPLITPVDKIAPALLAGCLVVYKPSEVVPLTSWAIAEAIHEVGFPPGVFNLVSGVGPTVGEALVNHPEVDMITFTGSTRAGMRIGSLAAGPAARFMLEMGGKSANIILDDADLDQALKPSVLNCFASSGQICTALTRLLVHRSHYAEAVERIKAIQNRSPSAIRPRTSISDQSSPARNGIASATTSKKASPKGHAWSPVDRKCPRDWRRDSSSGQPCSRTSPTP